MTAMCADRVLMDLLNQCSSGDIPKSNTIEEPPPKIDATLTYDQLVKDLIEHEKTYIRELNMISKVSSNSLLLFLFHLIANVVDVILLRRYFDYFIVKS